MKIRRMQPGDRPGLKALLHAQPHFRPEEIRVALELIDIALAHPAEEDYIILCAEEGEGEMRGYICYGKAPLTEAVYDVYWIVVHPECWGQGTGSSLLRRAELELAQRRARLLLIETSSTPPYELAHRRDHHVICALLDVRVDAYKSPSDEGHSKRFNNFGRNKFRCPVKWCVYHFYPSSNQAHHHDVL